MKRKFPLIENMGKLLVIELTALNNEVQDVLVTMNLRFICNDREITFCIVKLNSCC